MGGGGKAQAAAIPNVSAKLLSHFSGQGQAPYLLAHASREQLAQAAAMADEGRRPKRRCVQRKTALPSAAHYVGYVEDEEVRAT